MEELNQVQPQEKKRHGCVTAWIILMIVGNSFTALLYLFAGEFITNNLPGNISQKMIIMLGVVAIANVIFASMLLKWRKAGFWGFIVTSMIALFINLSIGLDIAQSVLGLAGIAILYGILQIKSNNVSAWDNLE